MKLWHEIPPQVLSAAFIVGVLGNLTAAVICSPLLWHLHRTLKRQHAERLAQAAVHHAAHMAAIRAAAEEMTATGKLLTDVKTTRRRT